MYSGSNDVNSGSSSVEFKDSDSLSNASDDELENLFEMILQVKEARHWQAVTSKEMKVFLAFLIISNGLVDEQYFLSTWSTKIFHTPNIRNLLSSQK
ncbi:hypothetical protein pdam_00012200 [Pocillopora damicornis]|uniref:Uncharacterized protein n=1 Tax=Pocillopora damicornis TaxID=46731 RepID=A0A3M6UEF5_POCDA|nr:hypothetical protein pdam_00012200 [Pocillopora damicornis]